MKLKTFFSQTQIYSSFIITANASYSIHFIFYTSSLYFSKINMSNIANCDIARGSRSSKLHEEFGSVYKILIALIGRLGHWNERI